MTPLMVNRTSLGISVLVLSWIPSCIGAQQLERVRSERDQMIERVVQLTNAERQRFGLKPLKIDIRLERAAQWMAEDMAIKGYFSHTDSLNRSIGQRVPTFGYTNYSSLRENLAAGYRTPEDVVKGWMESPSHRDAILCPKVEHIGVGVFRRDESKHKIYWVQEFGAEFD